ncbi:hypothetical protein LTR35_006207 [Friedmanniomyces endolithicus]|nr:hypothetical protein LTR35_006207 [Friedmanniomyces endolithicus]KAK0301317.1 hypothetical protein LTS00_000466 [Friedmanniomyces endolithicus]KAK1014497.1 hypothetical protein LTR54_004149 [Friedmanniomyces endolithicus]
MSKKQFRSQASSGKAAGGFGAFSSSVFGSTESSALSYIQEPPDYAAINDVNVVVAVKNLSKKDSTTKAKALEDIQLHVTEPRNEIEEGLLEAWVKLYPRLSIDSARRVRQLAHVCNGTICSKSGKRTARYLPRIVGSWLAGCYDSDRAAARAAQDALTLVFSSAEKVVALKKTFQGAILAYCKDALLHETLQTLSDERTVSPADAENTYARVVATSLAVVNNLLGSMPLEETAKHEQVYEDIIGHSKLWDFACHSDSGVRRSIHRLLQTALVKQPIFVQSNRKLISTAYIYKGLVSDQTGSSTDFVTTLEALSVRYPSIWTEDYSGKKPALSRFRQFLKHGSRSGSIEFWTAAMSLFTSIPTDVLPKTYEEAKDLLIAARDGVARREERFSASAAWPAYFTLVSTLVPNIAGVGRQKVIAECALPVIAEYLHPSPETTEWAIHGAKTAHLVAQVVKVPGMAALLEHEWPKFAEQLLELAKTSQPQQSKDFEKSQIQVAAAGKRWAALQREMHAASLPSTAEAAFLAANVNIARECAALLRSREGKPYGAAAILEELVSTHELRLLQDVDFRTILVDILTVDDLSWLAWPSRRQLIRCFYALSSEHFFPDCFTRVLSKAVDRDGFKEKSYRLLHELLPRNAPTDAISAARESAPLQDFVYDMVKPGPGEVPAALFLQLHAAGALTTETSKKAFSRLIASLVDTENSEDLALTLQFFATMDSATLRGLASKPEGDQLLSNLLRLEQHEDEIISQKAAAISSQFSASSSDASAKTNYSIVLQNLEKVSSKSLTMDALHELTDRLMGDQSSVTDLKQMLPSIDVWKSSVRAAVRVPKASLAILSPLGGAVNLVQASSPGEQGPVEVDSEGLSQALRIAMYVARLLASTDAKSKLAEIEAQWTVVALLHMCVILAEDNLSVAGTNALWQPSNNGITEVAVLDFVTQANTVLNGCWEALRPVKSANEDDEPTAYDQLMLAVRQLQHGEGLESPALRYYTMLADASITDNLFELHGHGLEQAKDSEASLKTSRTGKDTMSIAAVIVGQQRSLAGTQIITRFCNELVADLTDINLSDSQHQNATLEQLVLLNAIIHTQDDAVASIAKQRLIFLIKRLIPALSDSPIPSIKAEICKALSSLLPSMQDMYGDHWSQALLYVLGIWTSADTKSATEGDAEERILLTHATLKLYGTLRKLSKSDEPNDDLVDTLKDNGDNIYLGLVTLLKTANDVSDEAHQPLMVTHELLTRQIGQLPYQALPDFEELFPLLYTPSHAIQQGAFDLLRKQVVAAQEQISLDAALEKKTTQLPDELLSLILEAPTLDSLVDAPFDRTMPLPLQGYLYSWRLLFDHFDGSSYRVKTDYIEQLKESTYLSGLLSFTFDFLGHSRGKPVVASKFDIQNYMSDTDSSPERDVQWLLTHLYYLALTHLPGLVKSYFLSIHSRQTVQAVESWTAKYISPLVINASLQSLAEWAEKSVKEDPENEKMSVKVGMRSREVHVGYVVDEQTMAIKVVLPEAYPLAPAQVVGVSRVAVKEEKWQSWLRNCQGVITFSSGSIIDGLTAWRKNVTGALKGQTECAICYSIIDAHRQLPSKRCPTCKNLFHSGCLVKWFKTSNASTCPLCRNSFNFN